MTRKQASRTSQACQVKGWSSFPVTGAPPDCAVDLLTRMRSGLDIKGVVKASSSARTAVTVRSAAIMSAVWRKRSKRKEGF